MKSRFILQILYRIDTLYLQYLRNVDKKSEEVEAQLHKSTQNRELIELLKLEKSLVYFTTALRSNEAVLEKLLRTELIKKYPEDAELLEDVIVENKQAIEMANIYSGILSGMMDAFASVISNNLNIVMKVLAIVTIVMAIPTMIFSAYGMNVNSAGMPFAQSPWGFVTIIGIAAAISVVATLVFNKLSRGSRSRENRKTTVFPGSGSQNPRTPDLLKVLPHGRCRQPRRRPFLPWEEAPRC
jgi:magnesium transporter